MLKGLSIVSIHPSTNANKLEELQIKTNNRSKLPRIQIGNGEIKNHMDFSIFIKNGEGYGKNFKTF